MCHFTLHTNAMIVMNLKDTVCSLNLPSTHPIVLTKRVWSAYSVLYNSINVEILLQYMSIKDGEISPVNIILVEKIIINYYNIKILVTNKTNVIKLFHTTNKLIKFQNNVNMCHKLLQF